MKYILTLGDEKVGYIEASFFDEALFRLKKGVVEWIK